MSTVNVFAIKAKNMKFAGLDTTAKYFNVPVAPEAIALERTRKTYKLFKSLFVAPFAGVAATLVMFPTTFAVALLLGLCGAALGGIVFHTLEMASLCGWSGFVLIIFWPLLLHVFGPAWELFKHLVLRG